MSLNTVKNQEMLLSNIFYSVNCDSFPFSFFSQVLAQGPPLWGRTEKLIFFVIRLLKILQVRLCISDFVFCGGGIRNKTKFGFFGLPTEPQMFYSLIPMKTHRSNERISLLTLSLTRGRCKLCFISFSTY